MSEYDPKQKFKTSSNVLMSLFESGKSPLSEQFLRWKLWMKWREVVGDSIADHSEPVGLQNGMLYVWVKSSVWMQQMFFMKSQIKNSIHNKFKKGFIKDIRFTLDRRAVPQQNMTELKNQIQKLIPDEID